MAELDEFFSVSYFCYMYFEKILSIQIAQDPQKIKTMQQKLLRFKTSAEKKLAT